MTYAYDRVRSIDREKFNEIYGSIDYNNDSKFTRSDGDDIGKIERILDLRPGALKEETFYLEKGSCSCGRVLTFYDFVFTAIVDAEHPKSFILHTLLGSKLVANPPRRIRCSNCCRISDNAVRYGMPSSYLCIDPVADPNPPR